MHRWCPVCLSKSNEPDKESGKYDRVFQLWEAVKGRPNVAAYLASDRRQKYDWGIYRYYPDNDVLAESWSLKQKQYAIRDTKMIKRRGYKKDTQ